EHNREVVDMAISFEPLDVEGVDFRGVDVVAYKARKGRGRSGDIGLGKCFGAIRLLDNNNARIGKDHKASSTPAGSAGLHSERVALERCVRANWEPPLTNIMILGMQNSPGPIGKELYARGVRTIICFTELPPCPACLTWWKTLDSKFHPGSIRLQYFSWFEDYYGGKTPEERMVDDSDGNNRNEHAIEAFKSYRDSFEAPTR
ncbi:acetyltransferase, partial [Pseudomonas aeruginosa]